MFNYFLDFFTIKQVYSTLTSIIVTILIYCILNSLLKRIVIKGKDELDVKRRKTIVDLFQNILKYVFAIVLILIILQIFGINTKSFIAGLGIAGVVVGLALQDALKDIISGVSIIMDNYFVVGDKVEIKGFKGTVVSLGLKATKIQNDSGAINVLSNRNIDNVINYSKKAPSLDLSITINNDNKKEKVEQLLINIVEEMKLDNRVKNTSSYLGIEEITDNKIKYLVRIDCQRNSETEIRREFYDKIKELYDNNKLEK